MRETARSGAVVRKKLRKHEKNEDTEGTDMGLLLEERTMETTVVDVEAQKHNEMINERYRRLFSAEEAQLAESEAYAMQSYAPTATYEAPVEAYAPTVEQTPTVTEYVHERPTSPVFTTEKFARIEENQTQTAPATVASLSAKAVSEIAYTLSPLAKVVMAVFTAVVVAMITLICINTHAINAKSVRLKNLERQKEELMERNEDIQRRIDEARSEQAIRAYAESQGVSLG